MNSPRLKSYLVMGLLFVLGILAGGAGAYAMVKREHAQAMRDPQAFHQKRRIRALTRKLELDDKQRDQVAGILDRDAPKRRELLRESMDKCGEPLRKHKEEIDAEIRKVLRPEQVKKFDDLASRQGRRFLEEGIGP